MANNAIIIQGLIELHLKGEGGEQAVASMTKIVEQAKKVNEATGGFGAGAEKAGKGVESLNAQFVSLGKTVATYFAAGAIANFLKDSYLGFARTERQALATENQIRSLGQAAQGAGFRDFISQLSTTSGILDDDLVPAMQRALLAFKDYNAAQEVLGMAAKFAAAGIGDVGSNVEAISRFFQSGQARGLVQFGIDIKGGEEASLSLTEGLKLLRAQLALLPASFDDAQSSVNAARIAWDSFKDSVGETLDKIVKTAQLAGTELGGSFLFFSKEDQAKIESGEKEALDQVMRDAIEAYRNKNAKKTELDQQAADRQANIDRQKNADSVKAAIKAEKERIEKVADLNEKSAAARRKSDIDAMVLGSNERVAAEIEDNRELERVAIEHAKKIGADVLEIERFYRNERLKIINQPEAVELGPGNQEGMLEAEAAQRAHQEELTRILEEGLIKRLELVRDLAPEGSQEKLDAEAALQRAQLKINSDQKIRASKGEKDIILAIKKSTATAGAAIDAWQTNQTKMNADERTRAFLGAAQQTTAALGGLFGKNKSFAIAMAIANTALGITEVWASKATTGNLIADMALKVAATATVAASGYAQIAAIRSAGLGGGGGAPSAAASGGGSSMSAPTVPATNPNGPSSSSLVLPTQQGSSSRTATIRPFEGSGRESPPMTLPPLSASRVSALSARPESFVANSIVNIGTAFGDRQAMTKLAREINRINANNQGDLR